jgi:hypothetical protein
MNKFDARLTKMKGSTMERFCVCYDQMVSRAINLVYSGKSTDGIDFSTLPSDYCRECDLPVNVEKIKSINQQIDLILPMYVPVETMPENAKEAAESALPGVLPGLLPLEVSQRLQITLSDVNRHIRSGRLSLDASGKFIDLDSLNELQRLIQSKS